MERNSSLSLTQTLPIAESTCLNTSAKNNNFHWGGLSYGAVGDRNKTRGIETIERSNHMANSSSGKSVIGLNRSRIDPSVYADVQSKGLASRIVKYHEKRSRLSRSMSASNFYRTGEFPVVQLKKVELPCCTSKPNLSITRIAPPVRSAYYGNSLAGIMRCSSELALHRSEDNLSSENRPILHPPNVDNEPTPTRSVLDVLKEISRKRINTDNLDCNDSIKKYCNGNVAEQRSVLNASVASAPVNQKRPREQYGTSPQQIYTPLLTQELSQALPQSTANQQSPEQIAKRRNCCSVNNDIKSSLSSSQSIANKRKQNSGNLTQNVGKIARCSVEIGQTVEQADKFNDDAKTKTAHAKQLETDARTVAINADIVAQPKHTVSAPAIVNTTSNKPKLTLFNKECNENEYNTTASNTDNAVDNSKFSKIAFVTPKRSISVSAEKTYMKARTQKSKLALMLSGLRGELYSEGEEEDEEPTTKVIAKNEEKKNDDNQTLTSASAPSAQTSLTPIDSSFKLAPTTAASLTTVAPTVSTSISSAETIVTKASAASTATTIPATPLFTGPANVTKTPPSLNMGSFAATTTRSDSNTSPATTKSSSSTKITSPLVGIKLQPSAGSTATTTALSSGFNSVFPNFTSAAQTSKQMPVKAQDANANKDDSNSANNSAALAPALQQNNKSLSTLFGKPTALAQPIMAADVPAAGTGGFSFGISQLAAPAKPTSTLNMATNFAVNTTATATTTTTAATVLATSTTEAANPLICKPAFGGFSFATTSAAAAPVNTLSFAFSTSNTSVTGSGNPSFSSSTVSSASGGGTTAPFTFGVSGGFAAKTAANDNNIKSVESQKSTLEKPAFSFGGVASNATATSGFAGLTAAANEANAGKKTTSFTFGAPPSAADTTDKAVSSSTNAAASASSSSPLFGAANQLGGGANSMFSFGQVFSKPSTQVNTAPAANTSIFDASATAVASPSGGGGGFHFNPTAKSQAAAQPNSSGNIFGSSARNEVTSAANNSQSFMAGSKPAPFAFGGVAAPDVSTSFTFVVPSRKSQAASSNNSGIFGGQTNSSAVTKPAFSFSGNSTNTPSNSSSSAGTNFAASVPATGNTLGSSVSGNLFAPPAGTSSLGDRPIRRAHRRLQKPI